MRKSKNCSLFSLLRTSFEELFYENRAQQGLRLFASGLVRGDHHLGPQIPLDLCLNTRSHSILGKRFVLSSHSESCYHQVFHEFRVLGRLLYSSESGNGELTRCWNCGRAAGSPGPFLACGSCRSVQPVDQSVDFFQIFGLERAYEIKDGNLEGKYKDWQKKLHPDLVHSKSEKEKTFAAEQSARVIDAYRTLSKPLLRAIYLLKLKGIHVDEEKTVTDPDLLAEMMDIREAVEEANDSDALKQIQTQVEGKFETSSRSFHQAFERQDFDDAIASIERMRYYERALEEIAKKL